MQGYKLLFAGILMLMHGVAGANASELSNAIDAVRVECGNVAAQLNDMKKRAGINTAVTAVGTAAGGGALGTGIARTKYVDTIEQADAIISDLEQELEIKKNQNSAARAAQAAKEPAWNAIAAEYAKLKNLTTVPEMADIDDSDIKGIQNKIQEVKNIRAQLSSRATGLGNVRTGLAATSTATNVAGAVVASKNTGDGDLADAIRTCGNAVKNLSNMQMQARLDKTVTDAELNTATTIITACRDVDLIDTSKITKRAHGAMGASIAGAVTSGIATITSGVAVGRADATDKKTRDLDTTANVFSGVGTASSLTATVFNATQISAIKKAAQIIDKCEEVLK